MPKARSSKASMRLHYCDKCGTEVLLRAGIKGGSTCVLVYDADMSKQHRISCRKGRK